MAQRPQPREINLRLLTFTWKDLSFEEHQRFIRMYETGCKWKIKYATKHEAGREATRIAQDEGHEMHWYFCIFCGGYHTTSQKGP